MAAVILPGESIVFFHLNCLYFGFRVKAIAKDGNSLLIGNIHVGVKHRVIPLYFGFEV